MRKRKASIAPLTAGRAGLWACRANVALAIDTRTLFQSAGELRAIKIKRVVLTLGALGFPVVRTILSGGWITVRTSACFGRALASNWISILAGLASCTFLGSIVWTFFAFGRSPAVLAHALFQLTLVVSIFIVAFQTAVAHGIAVVRTLAASS